MDEKAKEILTTLSTLINNALMTNEELGGYAKYLQESDFNFKVEIAAMVTIGTPIVNPKEVEEKDAAFLKALRISV